MAEFCLDCLRKLDGVNYQREEFVLSRELELCEGCGQWKRVVIAERAYLPFAALVDWIGEVVYRIRNRGEDRS